MAKLKVIRLSQSKNQYGSFSYRIIKGEPEEGTKLYGEKNDIVYANQLLGVWNKPIEVEQFLGTSKSGKTYTAFSFDKEGNSFSQKGHTAHLAIGAGLDSDKVNMLKLLSELDEQELKVLVARKQLEIGSFVPSVSQPKAVNSIVVELEENTVSNELEEELSDENDKIKDEIVH